MKTIELLKTFSEPQRLRILNLLTASDLTVSEIVEILSLSQSNVSHHLKILKNQGLIETHKDGNQKYYRHIESPSLPANLHKIWTELKTLAKELPETHDDEKKLIGTLTKRKNADFYKTFNQWRRQQPDITFTAELALGGIPESGIALDIGCGTGDLFNVILPTFRYIIGIDLSLNQLESATENLTDTKTLLIQAEASEIPLEDNSIDSIYLRMTLRFFKKPEKILAEAARVVKDKGKISIIDELEQEEGPLLNFFQEFCQKNPFMAVEKYNIMAGLYLCVLKKVDSLG